MRHTHHLLSIIVALTVALASVSAASADDLLVEATDVVEEPVVETETTVATADTSVAPVTEVVADTTVAVDVTAVEPQTLIEDTTVTVDAAVAADESVTVDAAVQVDAPVVVDEAAVAEDTTLTGDAAIVVDEAPVVDEAAGETTVTVEGSVNDSNSDAALDTNVEVAADTTVGVADSVGGTSATASLNAMLSETTIVGDVSVDTSVFEALNDAQLNVESNAQIGDILAEADVALGVTDVLGEADLLDGTSVRVEAEVSAADVLPETILDGVAGVEVDNVLDGNGQTDVLLDAGIQIGGVGSIDAGALSVDGMLETIAPIEGTVLADVVVGDIDTGDNLTGLIEANLLDGDTLSGIEGAVGADAKVRGSDLSDGELIGSALVEAGGIVGADVLGADPLAGAELCASLNLDSGCDPDNNGLVEVCAGLGVLAPAPSLCEDGTDGGPGGGNTDGGDNSNLVGADLCASLNLDPGCDPDNNGLVEACAGLGVLAPAPELCGDAAGGGTGDGTDGGNGGGDGDPLVGAELCASLNLDPGCDPDNNGLVEVCAGLGVLAPAPALCEDGNGGSSGGGGNTGGGDNGSGGDGDGETSVDVDICAEVGLGANCDTNGDGIIDICVGIGVGQPSPACSPDDGTTGGSGNPGGGNPGGNPGGGTGGTGGGPGGGNPGGSDNGGDDDGPTDGDNTGNGTGTIDGNTPTTAGTPDRDGFGRTNIQGLSGQILAEQEANSLAVGTSNALSGAPGADISTLPAAGAGEIGTPLPMTPSILMAIATILAALGVWVMHAERRLN